MINNYISSKVNAGLWLLIDCREVNYHYATRKGEKSSTNQFAYLPTISHVGHKGLIWSFRLLQQASITLSL